MWQDGQRPANAAVKLADRVSRQGEVVCKYLDMLILVPVVEHDTSQAEPGKLFELDILI